MKKLDKSDTYKRKPITGKNFDYWFDWMVNNVETAEKEYPEMMELVREMVRETPPYFTASIIEKTPEHFVKWKNDIENCLTSTREKKIKTYIELIELLLYQLEFNTDIENNAVEKIKPELIEMEQYFRKLQHPSQKKKGFQSELSDNQIKSLYEQMQNYFSCKYDCFAAIFKPLSLIENFEKVIWLKRKTHLREFFTLLDITPTQKIVNELISDEKGNNIILPNQKKNEYSKYYSEMETIINTIKKTDL